MFVLEGCPFKSLKDGVFAQDGEWDGRPLYKSTAAGSDAALYWRRAKDQWVFSSPYSEDTAEEKKEGTGLVYRDGDACRASEGGRVPVGSARWRGRGPGASKWQDAWMTVRALTAAERDAAEAAAGAAAATAAEAEAAQSAKDQAATVRLPLPVFCLTDSSADAARALSTAPVALSTDSL